MSELLGIAGSGAIACGLAATASTAGDVRLWARSEASADRARKTLEKTCGRMEGAQLDRVEVVQELDLKRELLERLGGIVGDDAVLATTTSSLPIGRLAEASGRPARFAGMHVFNPVPRMALVELIFPSEASEDTRSRVRRLCEDMGKTAVEVPDVPGFVVNRLLFPYLFSAVRLQEETGLEAEAIDTCMKLGAGHPMGPLALLDLVGLDVSAAIGEEIGAEVPQGMRRLMDEGALGRKSGRGFYDYSR